jgi:pSer/pThr/pTyr-binding forkhead associated (FHA) protein
MLQPMDEPSSPNTLTEAGAGKLKAAGLLGRGGLLVVVSREQFGESRALSDAPLVVGRHGDCDFVLRDPLLSRRHFRIDVDPEGEFILEDLGSKNATFLNAREVRGPERLHYGDRIVAGSTVFRFLLEEQVERKAAAKRRA